MSSYAGRVDTGSGTPSPIGSTLYGICNTAANEAAKVVTLDNFDTLLTGATIHVKFTYGNTAASPTLAVGSTAAKPIYKYGTTAPGTTVAASWAANSMVSFTYDGTAWRMNDVGAEDGIIGLVTSEATTRENADTSLQGQIDTANLAIADREKKALVFTNKSATFSSGNGITNFGYRAAVACTGVTTDMIPYVAFGGNNAGSGNYANYCQTYNGGVYVYANTSGTITIPTIICWRP